MNPLLDPLADFYSSHGVLQLDNHDRISNWRPHDLLVPAGLQGLHRLAFISLETPPGLSRTQWFSPLGLS